jgi:hypothetical protein
MGGVNGFLVDLAEDLRIEMRRYHPGAQLRRAVGLFTVTFAAQLWSGAADWGWKSAGSTVVAAAYAGYRQLAPTMPWEMVDRIVRQGGAGRNYPQVGPPQEQIKGPGEQG